MHALAPPRDSAVDHMRKHLLVIFNVLAIFFLLSACPTQLVVVNCEGVKCQLVDGLLASHTHVKPLFCFCCCLLVGCPLLHGARMIYGLDQPKS